MESNEGSNIFSTVLSAEEWSQVPSEIAKKLEAFAEEKLEELITSKALYETKKAETEQNLHTIETELIDFKSKYEDSQSKVDVASKTITELESQISLCTTEMSKLQETCNRLENSTAEFRRQRDSAIDERDNLTKMLERRNAEIERLQTDTSMLSSQLNAAVNAKCEALAKSEEVSSMKTTLEYKERHMEQEKVFLNNQIKNLTEDLNKRAAELQNLRHEHTTRLILLETKLSKKSEELRIATETIASLTANNKSLVAKAEELNEKMKKQRDDEIKLQESFNNELLAQTRLAELYKGQNEENNAQVDELKKGISELQNLLRNASDQYGELETKCKESDMEHDEILSKKNECIVMLKKELDTANEMLKTAKEDSLHREIEILSPSAASASRMLKSGPSVTQIYSQLITVTDELNMEKEENRRLNSYIGKIVQEFEDKTPMLQKEREDYEQALETIAELTKHNENMIVECHRLRDECSDAKKSESRALRENERMKKEITDLSRQVCFLLKEVEASRTASTLSPDRDISMSDSISSADIISKKLVTFSDIQELQATNQKLLALVRELSSKQEEAECLDVASIVALKEKVNTLRESQTQMLITQERQNRMLEKAIKQRDNYRNLCQKSLKLPTLEDDLIPMDQSSSTESEIQNQKSTVDPEKEKRIIKELEEKLVEHKKELDQLKEEYDTYKKEKCANEKILVEQVDQLRKDHRELTQSNCKLTSLSEYNDERFKILKQNTEVYKNQINALEEKNKTYNSTIIKHEQSIMHLKDEALNAQTKWSRAEVALQNIQQECRLLRDSEARLLKEKEIVNRESKGQSLLLNNLELIKASLERSEAEGKMRLESRLDESMRECSALRRRLQEEQDKFRELSNHLERQTQNAQQRMEEEKQQADHLREELSKTREELSNKSAQIEELSKKIKNSMLLNRPGTDEQRSKELARQLVDGQAEIQSLKQQLTLSKENIAQYCNISECAEKELKKEHDKYVQFKQTTEIQLQENTSLIANLKDKVAELEAELSLQSSGQAETTIELKSQLAKIREELQVANEELTIAKENLQSARNDVKTFSEAAQIAEDKYVREMMLHSTDLQALNTVKEELTRVSSELNEIRHQKEQAVETLKLNKSGWEEREKLLQNEKDQLAKRLRDLDGQNSVLHDQIQALSTQLSVLHAQQTDTSLNQSLADASFNRSLTEDDVKSSEQLLQIIKYLRKEKDLAITKFEVLQAENLRLKSQYEMTDKELKETRNALVQEREGSEASMVTAAKHAEVLRKVETLNAITDSNKILRDERDALKMQLRELTARATSLEEQLAPLQDKNRELLVKADSASSENQALRAEATRWRQRANVLIEKANKVSPEDWRKLQNEREALAKMLTAEKEAHRRLTEEYNGVKQEKSRLEDQISNLSLQNRNQAKELKRQGDELNNIKLQVARLSQEVIEAREIAAQRTDENTKITEDLAAKDVMLTDIRAKETQVRKIAKKYKTQYEELAKIMEEEKKRDEEKAQASTIVEVPSEMQETYREEGRRELETRITELEKQHTDKLNELTGQVTSSAEENENLKKENTVLKTNESEKDERTKLVLKAAKMKITELTEERNKVRRDLSELRTRYENTDQNKSDDTRVARLEKEKNDAVAERQQERERFTREIETLNQRINQLQRQLGLPPASKPSTSSGSSEKSGSDPPTANIKPMTGHSNTQQQSATVMPWRGSETPFASIRPMSQLRTVTVLPTSQNSGSSSPSTAVLVPPQQQIVHTTGNSSIEVMSSSPTSSHTDYMPATSSASPAVAPIRQVAVPPTQQATIGMSSREDPPSAAESTQDMESETENQQPVMQQQQQQAVAMVLPRVEQQSSSSQTQNVEQSTSTSVAVVASSQQASSSNTVTTTQAGHKRPRETEGDSSTGGQSDEQSKIQQQTKRTRTQAAAQEVFQVGVTESGVEVEYQVPTSSQRDQEDDVVIVLSEDEGDGPDEGDGGEGEEDGMIVMEADDDAPFEESGDGDGDGYEMESYEQEQELPYDDADCHEMEDSEPPGDADDPNNEVEIIDDSSEVPNQSGSNSSVSAAPEQSGVGGSNGEVRPSEGTSATSVAQTQSSAPQSEAISSGSEGTSGVTLSQAAPSMAMFPRNRNVTPLSRQQQSHLLLPHGFEETGDDGIVPSTPTLYVPRRTDGFGEAVSSPHVPSGRFTFSDTGSAAPRGAGIAQVANEGIDDTRVDLSQLDDSGTGRSVPSTPLQVSPQGEQTNAEGSAEVGPSVEEQISEQLEPTTADDVPAITVTAATEEAETSNQETDSSAAGGEGLPEGVAGTSSMGGTTEGSSSHRAASASGNADGQDESEDLLEGEEGTDGVSSEGEKPQAVEETEIEEGREAEASESPSSNTRSRSHGRGVATARRSSRIAFRSHTSHRPTPIVWNPGEGSPRGGPTGSQQQDVTGTRGRGIMSDRGNFATRHRARRMRQLRGPFGRF
ncbi:Megator [Carabus blaptoides fortunei]